MIAIEKAVIRLELRTWLKTEKKFLTLSFFRCDLEDVDRFCTEFIELKRVEKIRAVTYSAEFALKDPDLNTVLKRYRFSSEVSATEMQNEILELINGNLSRS